MTLLLFSLQLTNMLFKTPESKHGGDLIAFNIWRGRDHGLPGYNAYRGLFGLRKAKTFSELNDLFTPEVCTGQYGRNFSYFNL